MVLGHIHWGILHNLSGQSVPALCRLHSKDVLARIQLDLAVHHFKSQALLGGAKQQDHRQRGETDAKEIPPVRGTPAPACPNAVLPGPCAPAVFCVLCPVLIGDMQITLPCEGRFRGRPWRQGQAEAALPSSARRLQPGPHRLLLPPRAHGRHCAAAAPPPPRGARHFPAGPAERGPVPPRSIPAPSAALPWEGRHGEAAAGAGRAGRWGAGTDGAGTARREPALPSPALTGAGAAPGRALPCSPPSPACTHAPRFPVPARAGQSGAGIGRQRTDRSLRRAPSDGRCGRQALPGGWVLASYSCVKLLAVLVVAWGPSVSTGFSCA